MKNFETRLKTIEKVVDDRYGDEEEKQARAREAVETVIQRLLGNWGNSPNSRPAEEFGRDDVEKLNGAVKVTFTRLENDPLGPREIIVDTGIRRPGDE